MFKSVTKISILLPTYFVFNNDVAKKMCQFENFKIPSDPYGANFRPQIGHVQIFSFADCNFLSF